MRLFDPYKSMNRHSPFSYAPLSPHSAFLTENSPCLLALFIFNWKISQQFGCHFSSKFCVLIRFFWVSITITQLIQNENLIFYSWQNYHFCLLFRLWFFFCSFYVWWRCSGKEALLFTFVHVIFELKRYLYTDIYDAFYVVFRFFCLSLLWSILFYFLFIFIHRWFLNVCIFFSFNCYNISLICL